MEPPRPVLSATRLQGIVSMLYFTYFMMVLHAFVGLILIGVILLQRGRGGGLAGAFGGMGGQSAFGTKAGDVFTKITIYLATSWIILGCVCVLLASSNSVKTTIFKGGAKAGVKTAGEEPENKTNDGKAADGKKTDDIDIPAPAPAIPQDGKLDVKTDPKTDVKTEGDGDGAKSDVKAEPKDAAPAEKTEPAKKEDPAAPKDPAAKDPEKKDPVEKKPE